MLTLKQNIDRALEITSKSYFTSKAQQKDALNFLSRAYDCVSNTKIVKGSYEERLEKVINIPNTLHH